ncbi:MULTISPECIES: enoyl-CoA hydratase/isomerase family protein [unclassified Afipia]|uniref:enoyl-CoA hydratase/isomerase family protein n=1 Tax=unclassified Afipia TaxID=2642050 RepID=UPI0004639108|nr:MULTISPECIES: enoyl-CoA hydratase/isomerase family protein [unclassified Afipia]
MAHLKHRIDGELAIIALSTPPQNRLSPQMVGELEEAVTAIGNSKARALLLHAEGPDFSFGGDIVPWPDMDQRELRTLFERYMNVFNRFERIPIPTVAAVQGLCFGGGLELAIRADVIFASETAQLGHPEQSLAIVTLLGGIYRVAERAGRSKAMEWALTSERVSARVMEQYGIVNHIVTDGSLFEEARAFAAKLAEGATRAHAAHKALLRIWATGGISAADEAMFDIVLPLFESEDVKLAMPASAEAYKANKPRPSFPFKGR